MTGRPGSAGAATTTAMRRVTVIAPNSRVDVSLPQQSTVAELVPMLVRMTAGKQAGTGWTLGRLGGDAFANTTTVAEAGIRDGELLYLNPRGSEPAPLLFDDVVDAIASAAAEPSGMWRPGLTRAVGLATALVAFAGAAVLIPAARPAFPIAALVDSGLAFGLLLAAAALGRGTDPWLAGTLAGAGLPAAFLAGVSLGLPDGGNPFAPSALAMAAGCGALALYGVLAAAAVPDALPWFIGAALAAGVGLVGAAVAVATAAPANSVAAVIAAGTLALSPLLPVTALRMGRLPLPRVPVDVAEFRRDERPTLGPEVASRVRSASDGLAGLLAAVAIVVVASAVVLAWSGDGWAWTLAALAGLAMLLRARAYPRTGQRAALVVGGIATLLVVATGLAGSGPRGAWPLLILGLLVTGLVGLSYAARARANQPSPYWTRFLDVTEVLAVVSLIPLAAGVLDLYQTARAVGR
ncbi:MAG TPA: type VII secretion integral membrane protein EccD [Natronosporangium sp.]